MQYRFEIDGMRALAVMSVLFSHAGLPWFSGGSVGVDVFFVISGLLITGIILDDLQAGRFSIAGFYERRARRILPAVFTVMIASLIAGWFLMSADAYQNLGQSITATTLFANNVLLTLTSGYWDMESSFKPLLHTWSLGVEEQYYFVVPLVLILVHRFARSHIALSIALIGLLSFAVCLSSIDRTPVANFYLLHTRAWELAAGGVAAVWLRNRAGEPPASDFLSCLGLAMIVGSVIAFPEALPAPSPYMLLPVAGTVLVLIYCRAGIAHRLLTLRPVVLIGLASYSIYLWHQPLYAFLRTASLQRPEPWQYLIAIAATLVLAYPSYRYVETPFRDRSRVSTKALVLTLVPVAVFLIIAGVTLHFSGGVPARLPVAPGAEPAGTYKPFNMSVFRFKQDAFATSGAKLLVVGNSTARDFVNMLRETGELEGYEIVYRDDLEPCDTARSAIAAGLVERATLVAMVGPEVLCDGRRLAARPEFAGKIVVIGPRDFGDNLNPIARIPLAERGGVRVRMSDEAIAASHQYRRLFPKEILVDTVRHLSTDDRTVPVFDEAGRMLSEDRKHVTRSGARFVGKRIFTDPVWIAARKQADARAGRR